MERFRSSAKDPIADLQRELRVTRSELDQLKRLFIRGLVVQGDVRLSNQRTPSDASVTNAKIVAGILGSKLEWSVGSSPPASPVTGDLWICNTTGIYWPFIYDNSETTYKWKFIGAAPAYSYILAAEGTAVTANYVNLGTVGPSITLPRNGDYIIDWGSNLTQSVNGSGGRAAPAIGATAPADSDSYFISPPTSGVSWYATMRLLKTGLTGGDAVTIQYKAIVSGTATFGKRFMSITPVRVI